MARQGLIIFRTPPSGYQVCLSVHPESELPASSLPLCALTRRP